MARRGEVLTTYAVKVDEQNDSFTTSDAILKQAPLHRRRSHDQV